MYVLYEYNRSIIYQQPTEIESWPPLRDDAALLNSIASWASRSYVLYASGARQRRKEERTGRRGQRHSAEWLESTGEHTQRAISERYCR